MSEIAQQLNAQSQALTTITVNDFFGQINWMGLKRLSENQTELGSEAPAPYETVGQFFATFPWQGEGTLMSNVLETEIEEDELEQFAESDDVLTLDDLSALF